MDTPHTALENFSFAAYFKIIWARKWFAIGVLIVVLGLGVAYILFKTPVYEARSFLLKQTASFDQALFQTQVFQLNDPQRELQTGSDLVKLPAVAEMVKSQLDTRLSPDDLARMVSTTASTDTNLIGITASSHDPAFAVSVADAFATQFLLYRQQADRAVLERARQQIMAQYSAMTAAEKASSQGLVLSQRGEDLRVLESMQTGGYEIAQTAVLPTSPSSPRPVRTMMVAFLVGLVAGIGAAFAANQLDRRVHNDAALERELDLPVLARIPVVGSRWRSRKPERVRSGLIGFAEHHSPLLEPYRELRSNLKYFGIDRDRALSSLVITSGLPEEGKTVTAINLALSFALSGSSVVLIEADLRRPALDTYLGLANGPGLSSVLVGSVPFSEAARCLKISEFISPEIVGRAAGLGGSRLPKDILCLTSGPLPPNPAELLESSRMHELMQEAQAIADYVLVDTPPVLVVSDALSLVNDVDAVLLSTRIGRTRTDELAAIRTRLDRAGANLIGTVATAARRDHVGYARHTYGYYEKKDAQKGSGLRGQTPSTAR